MAKQIQAECEQYPFGIIYIVSFIVYLYFQIEKKAGELIDDPKLKRLKLPPANKLSRQIMYV